MNYTIWWSPHSGICWIKYYTTLCCCEMLMTMQHILMYFPKIFFFQDCLPNQLLYCKTCGDLGSKHFKPNFLMVYPMITAGAFSLDAVTPPVPTVSLTSCCLLHFMRLFLYGNLVFCYTSTMIFQGTKARSYQYCGASYKFDKLMYWLI